MKSEFISQNSIFEKMSRACLTFTFTIETLPTTKPWSFVRLKYLTVLASFFLLSSSATAQFCRGFPSFSAGVIGVGANAFVVPGTYGGGVSMAAGKASGVFGGFGAGLNTYNIAPVGAPDEFVSAARMSVNAGYDVSVSKSRRISLCPIVSVGHRFGPNYTVGSANFRESGNDYTAELAIGGAVGVGRKVDFVPTVSVGYSAVNWKLTQVGAGELTDSDTETDMTIGAGIVIASRFAIRPYVAVAFNENSDPAFGLSFRVQLGARR